MLTERVLQNLAAALNAGSFKKRGNRALRTADRRLGQGNAHHKNIFTVINTYRDNRQTVSPPLCLSQCNKNRRKPRVARPAGFALLLLLSRLKAWNRSLVHGREIIADMHQAFEIVCGLLFGYYREFFRIVAQTWFRNRNTDLNRVHMFSFLAGRVKGA